MFHCMRFDTEAGADTFAQRLGRQGFTVTDIAPDDGKIEVVYKATEPMIERGQNDQ
tara:strand:+ start:323 stop:490 length:168 start_codon:yes stop_codon:yes gene_type:complete